MMLRSITLVKENESNLTCRNVPKKAKGATLSVVRPIVEYKSLNEGGRTVEVDEDPEAGWGLQMM